MDASTAVDDRDAELERRAGELGDASRRLGELQAAVADLRSHERSSHEREEGWRREREELLAAHERELASARAAHGAEMEEVRRKHSDTVGEVSKNLEREKEGVRSSLEEEVAALQARLAAAAAAHESAPAAAGEDRRGAEARLAEEAHGRERGLRRAHEESARALEAAVVDLKARLVDAEGDLQAAREENAKLMKITRDVVNDDFGGLGAAAAAAAPAGAAAEGAPAGAGERAPRDLLLEETVQGARKHMRENADLRGRVASLQSELSAMRRRNASAVADRKRLVEASVMIAALKGRQQVLASEMAMLREVVSGQVAAAMDVTKEIMSGHTRSAQHRIASEGELSELRAKCRAAEAALDWERKRAETLLKRERDRADRERRHREELEHESKRRELQATEYIRMAYGELGSTGQQQQHHHRPPKSAGGGGGGPDPYQGMRRAPPPGPHHHQQQHMTPPLHRGPPGGLPQLSYEHDEFHTPYAASEASMASSMGTPHTQYLPASGDRGARPYHQPLPVRASYHQDAGGARASSSVSAGDFSSFNEWYKWKMHRWGTTPPPSEAGPPPPPPPREARGAPTHDPRAGTAGDAEAAGDCGAGAGM